MNGRKEEKKEVFEREPNTRNQKKTNQKEVSHEQNYDVFWQPSVFNRWIRAMTGSGLKTVDKESKGEIPRNFLGKNLHNPEAAAGIQTKKRVRKQTNKRM